VPLSEHENRIIELEEGCMFYIRYITQANIAGWVYNEPLFTLTVNLATLNAIDTLHIT
jgi:hypothetical protein